MAAMAGKAMQIGEWLVLFLIAIEFPLHGLVTTQAQFPAAPSEIRHKIAGVGGMTGGALPGGEGRMRAGRGHLAG
jgi:hypothetical protein